MIQSVTRFMGMISLAACLLACTSMPVAKHVEPPVIIVRNSSRTDIQVVTLSLANAGGGQSAAGGSISPVPRGVSQVYNRPSTKRPLSGIMEVHWTEKTGSKFSKKISVKEALAKATGQANEKLVFDINPRRGVDIYLEY